jgi:hypothetical protein
VSWERTGRSVNGLFNYSAMQPNCSCNNWPGLIFALLMFPCSKSLICQMHDVEADEEVNLPTNIPANIPTNIPTHTPTSSPPNPRSNNVVSSAERPEAIFSKDLPTKNENEHPEQPLITRSQSQEQISTSIPTTTATTNISAPTPTSSGNTDTEKSTETNSEVSNNDEAQVAQVPTTQISAPHPPGTIQPVHVALAIARTDLFDFLLPFIKSYYDEPNNEPRFDFGCWRVEKKLTDPEQVDILFPKDEDYFEWRGPARGKFEFRIQKVDDRLPVSVVVLFFSFLHSTFLLFPSFFPFRLPPLHTLLLGGSCFVRLPSTVTLTQRASLCLAAATVQLAGR